MDITKKINKFSCVLLLDNGQKRYFEQIGDESFKKDDFIKLANSQPNVTGLEDVADKSTRDKTKDGYWNRNKAKQYKPLNPENKMDMAVGNGRWGDTGRMMIYVKRYGPTDGKDRRVKKKKGCRLVSRGTLLQNDFKVRDKILAARSSILTLKLVEEFLEKDILTQEMHQAMKIINNWVEGNMSAREMAAMYLNDTHRNSCTVGRLKKSGAGNFKVDEIRQKALMAVDTIIGHQVPKFAAKTVSTELPDCPKERFRKMFKD